MLLPPLLPPLQINATSADAAKRGFRFHERVAAANRRAVQRNLHAHISFMLGRMQFEVGQWEAWL